MAVFITYALTYVLCSVLDYAMRSAISVKSKH